MSAEAASPKQNFTLRVRSTDLDAPTLVDRIATELLDHLCVCQTCLSVFAAQQESIETAGCVEGIRIVSRSQVRWEERRAALALGHITDETLDDYLFGRLTGEEEDAINHHAAACARCATTILNRETLIDSIKSAFGKQSENKPTKSEAVAAVSVRVRSKSFCVARTLTLSRNRAVVIVNRNNPISCLPQTQLRFFFLRLISHWPWGAAILPVDLPDGSEVRKDFLNRMLKAEPEEMEAYWMDQANLRGIERPVVVSGAAEVKKWIGSHSGAIGYIRAEDLDDMVRVIEVT